MGVLYCDGDRFRKALVASASWLSENSETLNRLNVFPVPDGDTGSNMSLTLISAVDELKGMEGASLEDILEASARGALMGARGCSGVILSQLIAGFAEVGKGKTKFYARDIINGLQQGTKRVYKAVTEPKEGTMLTVIREASDEAVRLLNVSNDIVTLLETILNKAKESLDNTPKLLPVLAQAGVVDAGGQGFVYILEGILKLLHGEPLNLSQKAPLPDAAQSKVSQSWDNPYCTEFILSVKDTDTSIVREDFEKLGNDLLVVGWKNLLRVHIHTDDPEKVLAHAHYYGKPSNVKIDDMKKQHTHILQSPVIADQNDDLHEISIVAVVSGDGIGAIFKSLGADTIIMSDKRNPSVSEILQAIDSTYSNEVIFLPNDDNIIPAAIQASNISNKKVAIVRSENISQGLSAIVSFQPNTKIDKNVAKMLEIIKGVKHGEVTRAIRSAQYEDLLINEGDFIGRFNGKLVTSKKTLDSAVFELVKLMLEPENEVISIFYGADIKRSEAEKITEKIRSSFPEQEIELHYGGQAYCSYIISIE
ncbi:MAG: DAK2 domain-containing protein [bacterium]